MVEYSPYLDQGYYYGQDDEYLQEEDSYLYPGLTTEEFYEDAPSIQEGFTGVILGNAGNTSAGYYYDPGDGYYQEYATVQELAPRIETVPAAESTDWDSWFGVGGGGESIEEYTGSYDVPEAPTDDWLSGWVLPDFSGFFGWFEDPEKDAASSPLDAGLNLFGFDTDPQEGDAAINEGGGLTMAVVAAVIPVMIIMPLVSELFSHRR